MSTSERKGTAPSRRLPQVDYAGGCTRLINRARVIFGRRGLSLITTKMSKTNPSESYSPKGTTLITSTATLPDGGIKSIVFTISRVHRHD
jgi:hypothetical protein